MRQQLFELTLCGALIGVLSLIAFTALSFFWTQLAGGADVGTRVTAIMFAPFALIAIAIPAFAVPMMRRVFGAFRLSHSEPTVARTGFFFMMLWIASECIWLVMRAIGEASVPLPVGFHVLLAGYAIAGAMSVRDRTTSEDKSVSP